MCALFRGDMQFISRLVRLVRHFVPASCTTVPSSEGRQYLHGKYCMLAFDKFVDPQTNEEDDERTTFVRAFLIVLISQ